MKLSVVIPAYNEEENIKQAVLDVVKQFPEPEIIVVNDASTDHTQDILVELMALPKVNLRLLVNKVNHGHGFSVIKGLRAATGDYVLYIDADRQIELSNLKRLEGDMFDFVSGWRTNRQDKPFRKFISFCLKMTNLFRYGYYIQDANCPFKLYKRSKLQPLLEKLPISYIIPVACLEVLARKHKLKTVTIQTPHQPYQGIRKGFLQTLNAQTYKFFADAFFEIVRL